MAKPPGYFYPHARLGQLSSFSLRRLGTNMSPPTSDLLLPQDADTTAYPENPVEPTPPSLEGPPGVIFIVEELWRSRSIFLESKGYRLRDRLRQGWVPSWTGTGVDPYYLEDFIGAGTIGPGSDINTIDATREKDGAQVFVKAVYRETQELDFPVYFSADEWRDNSSNHFIPVLDVLDDPLDPNVVFMIMPYVRSYDNPSFSTLEEVFDFMEQVLRGLQFMHDQGIAHRNCMYDAIVMDAHSLYPNGHHPVRLRLNPDRMHHAPHIRRSKGKVTYYFTNFSSACYLEPGVSYVSDFPGRTFGAPELCHGGDHYHYDPYKLDIFILGNLFYDILDRYRGLLFLRDLPYEMIRNRPEARPNARTAYRLLQQAKNSVPAWRLRWRLQPRREGFWLGVARDGRSLTRELTYHIDKTLHDRNRLCILFWVSFFLLLLYHSYILS